MPIFIDGKHVKIPLERLIAEGEDIIAQEGIQPSKLFDLEIFAASIAVARYDKANREWVKAQKELNPNDSRRD
jgi:hypothetical protein